MSALFPATLQISLFSSEIDNLPKAVDMKWVDLCEKPVFSQRKQGVVCWSPAVFKHERSKAGVLSVNALVFDLDSDLTETLIQRLSPYNYVVHSTFTPGRWRVILQTSRPHSPHEHATLWGAMAESLGGDFDEACKDSSRLYYWGTVAPGRTYEKYENFEGQPVDVDAVLAQASSFYARPTAPPPLAPTLEPLPSDDFDLDEYRAQVRESKINPARKPLTLALLTLKWGPTKGERDNTLLAAIGGLFTVATPVPSEELCEFLSEHVLSNMDVEPEGREAWHKVFMSMCARNRKWRLENDAKKLSADAAFDALTEKQGQERGEAPDWRKGFQGKPDDTGVIPRPAPSGFNVALILENDARFKTLRFNVVTRKPECAEGPLAGVPYDVIETSFSNWLSASEYRLKVSRPECKAQIDRHLTKHTFDPLKDYLTGLRGRWDGTTHISKIFRERCGAKDQPDFYLEGIARKFFISAVARGLVPGTQVDTMLILQGEGGIGKTSFIRALGGAFVSEMTLNIHDKDALMGITGNWLVEQAEMSTMKKADEEGFRAFLTRTTDNFRPPYGRSLEDFPRRCVFIGTSNTEQMLGDVDGQRRYWPVRCGDIQWEWLRDNRDALWAEAIAAYDAGESHFFSKEEKPKIDAEVAMFQKSEPFAEAVEDWFLKTHREKRPTEITSLQMLRDAICMQESVLYEKRHQMDMAKALKALGFVKYRSARAGRSYMYKTPETLLTGAVTKTGTMVSVAAKEERENG